MMEQFCTMCDQYYRDPAKHRYVDCPFYNGCPCGIRPATKQHVEKCFMARERSRKAQKGATPMVSNISQTEFTCVYCFRPYYSAKEEHETKFCMYFVGCTKCGAKGKDFTHSRTCKGKEGETVSGAKEIELVCRYCRSNVPMSKYDDHMQKECGPRTVNEIVEATEKRGLILLPPAIPEWKRSMVWCPFCGTDIVESYIETHQVRCKEQLKTKFEFAVYTVGEVRVYDNRRAQSIKDLREVIFVEEGP
jgi:hypothetical protein